MNAESTRVPQFPAHWLRPPLRASLMRFNWLPSLDMHPTWRQSLAPAFAERLAEEEEPLSASAQRLHRHWSAQLLQTVPALADARDPLLMLAVLPAPAWARLSRWGTAVLLGTSIRRTIIRADVLELRALLGPELVAFTRGQEGQRLCPDWPTLASMRPEAIAAALGGWGETLLAQAFKEAQPALGARVRWRLPRDIEQRIEALPVAQMAPAAARDLLLGLMAHAEPQWHSCFQTVH